MLFDAGSVDDFVLDEIKSFKVDFFDFCVVKHAESFYSFRNACPHQHMPLDMGLIKKGNVICTLHGWVFELGTGNCLVSPTCSLTTYEAQVKDRRVLISLE
jgi:nitrite reductase/ring-hydroxylating ferredoxin subunit